jgi:hypothetical protein
VEPLRQEMCVLVFPARAGMNRAIGWAWLFIPRVPRPRGDEPEETPCSRERLMCSPPARG